MFELKPIFGPTKKSYESQEFLFHGTIFWKICYTESGQCYDSLPIAHCGTFPIRFSPDSDYEEYHESLAKWLAKPMINVIRQGEYRSAKITRIKLTDKRDAIVINCLDATYGHVLYKLFNVAYYKNQDMAIIALIPKCVSWLVPDYVDEIWEVDCPLSHFKFGISGLDQFVKKEIDRFSSVYLSKVRVEPEISEISYEEFTRTSRFNLMTFNKEPKVITFVIREDRFVLSRGFYEFVYLATIKFGLFYFFRYFFVSRQIQLFASAAKKIKRSLPTSEFYIVGKGNSFPVPTIFHDFRTDSIDTSTEFKWLNLYKKSHLVIGVHGSNMMLPTLMAAGFLCLVPQFKIDHYGEDILLPYENKLLYRLGRYLIAPTTASGIARHAVSVIKKFQVFT